jgi:tetratricopeptide (TPR) repeat protein
VQSYFPEDAPIETIKALVKIAPYFQPVDAARSEAIFNLARQHSDALSDLNQKASALAVLTAAYTLAGQNNSANQTFTELLQITQSNPVFTDLSAFWDAKLYEQAFTIAQTVPPADLTTPAPIVAIETLLAQESFSLETAARAEALIALTQKPEIKTELWLKLANYYQALGQTDRALTTLQNATTAALTIADPEVRNYYLYPYRDTTDRASQLENIALYYAYLGQTPTANQVLNRIQTADIRASVQAQVNCF